MSINEFDKIIKRNPMHDRLIVCQDESRNRFDVNKPKIFDGKMYNDKPANYELELIAFRSVIMPTNEFYRSSRKWLLKSTEYLRNNDFFNTKEIGIDEVISRLSFLQIETQIDYKILFYRYNYFFNYKTNNLDMNHEFIQKFNVEYKSFIKISFLLSAWATTEFYKMSTLEEYMNLIFDENEKMAINHLKRKPDEFIEEYNELNLGLDLSRNIFFDLNLLIKYPIVDYNEKMFIPYAPYIPYSCTRSLMFRLTNENNTLREKIGKNVMEEYLKYISDNSLVTNSFNKISEFTYSKENKKSSDLIIHSDDKIVFIESKLFNQSLKLRSFDEEAINSSYVRVADAIIQILRNIVDMTNNEMNRIIKKYDLENTFGMVVLYDDFYFNLEMCFDLAFTKSKEKGYDFTKDYIKSSISVFSLLQLENNLNLYGGDIFQLLKKENLKSEESRLINYQTVINELFLIDKDEIESRIRKNRTM
jgi:hypothetical protein